MRHNGYDGIREALDLDALPARVAVVDADDVGELVKVPVEGVEVDHEPVAAVLLVQLEHVAVAVHDLHPERRANCTQRRMFLNGEDKRGGETSRS